MKPAKALRVHVALVLFAATGCGDEPAGSTGDSVAMDGLGGRAGSDTGGASGESFGSGGRRATGAAPIADGGQSTGDKLSDGAAGIATGGRGTEPAGGTAGIATGGRGGSGGIATGGRGTDPAGGSGGTATDGGGGSATGGASLASAINGPLRANPANSRYFTDETGRAIYLTGSHTWASFQDLGYTDPPPLFDYEEYLGFLDANNHNFIRLWSSWEQAKWATWTSSEFWFAPMPYLRPGPALALDGKPQFDLTQFNQAYFDRLRDRVSLAAEHGIYVSVMLFDGFSVESKGDANNPWPGHPFNSANNVNGIDGDSNSNGSGEEVHTLEVPAINALQEEYIRKVIDTVNDLDNVIYEVCNECDPNSLAWQAQVATLVKDDELTKSKQHPVGMAANYAADVGAVDDGLESSPADWISPASFAAIDASRKVVFADTDHFFGIGGDAGWAWQAFMRGANVLFMDAYDGAVEEPGSSDWNSEDPVWVSLRANLGHILGYAQRMDMNRMTPRGAPMFSTGYGMAGLGAPYAEYIGYLPDEASITIDLSSTPGTLAVEWFNPATGGAIAAAAVEGGASRLLTAPFSGSAVVYLKETVQLEG